MKSAPNQVQMENIKTHRRKWKGGQGFDKNPPGCAQLTHEKASGLKQSGLQPPHLPRPAALKIVSATYCRLNMKSGKNTGQERLSRFSSGKISTLTLEPRAWVMSKPHRDGICYIPVQREHDILKCLLIASGRQGNDYPGFVFQPAEQMHRRHMGARLGLLDEKGA